jgi:hypothetical protein
MVPLLAIWEGVGGQLDSVGTAAVTVARDADKAVSKLLVGRGEPCRGRKQAPRAGVLPSRTRARCPAAEAGGRGET